MSKITENAKTGKYNLFPKDEPDAIISRKRP